MDESGVKTVHEKYEHAGILPRSLNNGGWPAQEIPVPDQLTARRKYGRACDFDVVDGSEVMSDLDEFVRKYVIQEKPVLIKDLLRHDPRLQRCISMKDSR